MRLNKLGRKTRMVSLITLAMMAIESPIMQYIGDGLSEASAAAHSSVTSGITFNQGGAQPAGGKYYAKSSYLSDGTVNITEVPAGQVIKSITLHGEDITPPFAIGKKDYSGPVNDAHSSVIRDVTSIGNDSGSLGYYAWYRYIPGGSQGSNWYADVYDKAGNPVKISCGPDDFGPAKYHHSSSASLESINGHPMPILPGCASTDFPDLKSLSLGANKNVPFKLSDDNQIPDSVVWNVKATGSKVNTNLPVAVNGPDANHTGYPRASSISGIDVAPDSSNAAAYRVTFQQDFTQVVGGFESSHELSSGAPNGAKVITYYEAFVIDLVGKTYEYDNKVTVTYETPPNAPNLSSVVLTAPSCVQMGSSTSFTFSFNNTGGSDITVPFTAKVLIDGSVFQTFNYTGLGAGQGKIETFTKSFGGTTPYGISVIIDTVPGELITSDNSASISITPKTSCAATPTPEVITGDFTMDHTTISYGQSNWMTPVGVAVTGGASCVISKFGFIFEQNGIIRNYVHDASSPSTQGFSGPPYPGGMGEGYVNVTMQITSSCGTTKTTAPKSFNITIPPNNAPPRGEPGWFANHNTSNYPYINEVVIGNYVDLGIVQNKMVQPNEPYDPDGDGFFPTWDFAGSSDPWIQNLADTKNGYGFYEHDERFGNIKADVLGMHTVFMQLTDTRGAQSGRRAATINVVKPNPIAACAAPTQIKSNRPLAANAINADSSRSPLGRAIDHSKDDWTNKQPTYQNTTLSDITVTVKLNKVYDSAGLESENSSSCNIIVHPDYPPIAKINAPTLGIRGEHYDILNESYSPDGDILTDAIWSVQYDANNNGVFDANEPWTVVSGNLSKFDFVPTKVGKYKFKVRAVEEYGAWAEAESGIMDVINQAPEVSFDLSGNGPNPDPNPPTLYKASDILKNWNLVATNTNTLLSKLPAYNWQNENEALQTGSGKGKESQNFGVNTISTPGGFGGAQAFSSPLNDNGYGKNGVAIYKALSSPTPGYSQPLLTPGSDGKPSSIVSGATPIESDKIHLYYQLTDRDYNGNNNGNRLYALNKNKIGRYQLELVWSTPCSGCYSSGSYVHRWLDGNPYDYSLSYDNIPIDKLTTTKTVPHYRNTNQDGSVQIKETIARSSVNRIIVAEKTIYVMFTKVTPTKVVLETSSDDDRTYTYSSNISMACSFKTLDAALVGCYEVPGLGTTIKTVVPNGDHLVFLTDSDGYYSTNGYFGNSATEIDMYGNIVNITNISANNEWVPHTYEMKYVQYPYTDLPRSYVPAKYTTTNCHYVQTATPYKDRDGNTYFYEEKQCQNTDGSAMRGTDFNIRAYPELALGIYVAKYNKDFKIVWRARTGGNSLFFSAAFTYNWFENLQTMIVNPLNNTIVTKTLYTIGGTYGDNRNTINNTIDMNTGSVWGWTGPTVSGMDANIHVDAYGNYQTGVCASNIYNQCTNISTGGSAILSGTVGSSAGATENVGTKAFQEYMGDGLLLTSYMYHQWSTGYNSPPYGQTEYWIDKGPVAEATPVVQRYQYGQFISPNTVSDVEHMFNFKAEQNKIDTELFGYSFRMQDGLNRYALEFNGTDVYLAKYVNGIRTILGTSSYNVQDGKSYNVKIRSIGNTLNVWINKVNYFVDIVDNSYPILGKFGVFSNKSFVAFSAMTTKPFAETDLWNADYAILNEQNGKAELKYDNIIFNDPEMDPMAGSFTWTYQHAPMFLDNGGLSPLNGQNFSTGQPVFDKVGKWDVVLKAKDDPYPDPDYKFPDMTWDSYRKNSNIFKKSIIVHRRPVAEFGIVMEPNGDVRWTDTSYDPDRFNGVSGSYEPGYQTSRGIVNRRYWFISPDGAISTSKLTKVSASGTYTVGLQVQDEFGAWSWVATNTLDVGLKLNNPPKAVLTYPTGSSDTPTYLPVGTQPTISWEQTDIDEGTTFTAFEVMATQVIKDSWGSEYNYDNSVVKSFNTQEETYYWLATNITGNTAYKWKVKVRVKDENLWSTWSNEGWFSSMKPPNVTLTFPTGTYDNPTAATDIRPTIKWGQADPQAGRIAYQQVRVWSEDGTLVAGTDISVPYADRTKTSDSWTMNADAPRGSKLKVQVRVMNESSVWSDWSNIGWLTTNSAPTATMIDPSGTQVSPTVFNTTTPTLRWSQTDPDLNTVFTYFQMEITSEDNTVRVLDSTALEQNTNNTTASWTVPSDLPAGKKLRVRVRVYDGYVWSNYSAQTWMVRVVPEQSA